MPFSSLFLRDMAPLSIFAKRKAGIMILTVVKSASIPFYAYPSHCLVPGVHLDSFRKDVPIRFSILLKGTNINKVVIRFKMVSVNGKIALK